MLATERPVPPETGLYDISNEEYHSSPGISRSGIMEFMRAPIHYWNRYINPARKNASRTPEMMFGNLFHMHMIEPALFAQQVVIVPECDRRTTAGKTAWAMHEAKSFGKIVIEQDTHDHLLNMRRSIMANATARALVEKAQYEKSLWFPDTESGMTCKARPDILHAHFAVDLKTTKDASFRGFQNDMVAGGFHIQAAMIIDAVQHVLGTSMDEFVFIAIEKLPPYAIGIWPLDAAAIDAGRTIYRKKLLEIRECMERNEWPGYTPQVVALPAWAMNYNY